MLDEVPRDKAAHIHILIQSPAKVKVKEKQEWQVIRKLNIEYMYILVYCII